METTNECECKNVQLIKRGFSGTNAVLGIIGCSMFSAFILWFVFSYAEGLTFNIWHTVLIIAASIFSGIGVFAGTIDMNNIQKVCINCGKIESLNVENKSLLN